MEGIVFDGARRCLIIKLFWMKSSLMSFHKDSHTLAQYRFGLANLYLENFIVWLESQGYRRFTIRRPRP